MSDGRKYYCMCDSNCKFETMTKEQILAAIAQAVETGSVGDCDTGFITKVKENNTGSPVTMWVGTREQYNAIPQRANNCLYIITDDTTGADLVEYAENMAADCRSAAKSAGELAKNMQTADVSGKVVLSVDGSYMGQNLTVRKISEKKYIYSPALGMVFFMFSLTYKGSLSKGEQLRFYHIAEGDGAAAFMPKTIGGMVYPITARRRKFAGEYWADQLVIYAEEDIATTDIAESMDFCGWYYCNGGI